MSWRGQLDNLDKAFQVEARHVLREVQKEFLYVM